MGELPFYFEILRIYKFHFSLSYLEFRIINEVYSEKKQSIYNSLLSHVSKFHHEILDIRMYLLKHINFLNGKYNKKFYTNFCK